MQTEKKRLIRLNFPGLDLYQVPRAPIAISNQSLAL
jgi:hypothetical protein